MFKPALFVFFPYIYVTTIIRRLIYTPVEQNSPFDKTLFYITQPPKTLCNWYN